MLCWKRATMLGAVCWIILVCCSGCVSPDERQYERAVKKYGVGMQTICDALSDETNKYTYAAIRRRLDRIDRNSLRISGAVRIAVQVIQSGGGFAYALVDDLVDSDEEMYHDGLVSNKSGTITHRKLLVKKRGQYKEYYSISRRIDFVSPEKWIYVEVVYNPDDQPYSGPFGSRSRRELEGKKSE